MSKNFIKVSKHQTGRNITTKTPYGSTSDMIVTDENVLKKISINTDCVLLQDDEGYYITHKTHVDNGLADPFRHSLQYRETITNQIMKELNE